MGSGGPSIENVILAADKTREKSPKRMGPFVVPRTMSSTASATLAVPFKIKGVNYTISSACATSGHCIGNAMELIQLGKQKIIFAGGSDEVHFAMTAMFDAMTAFPQNIMILLKKLLDLMIKLEMVLLSQVVVEF